MSTKWTFDIWLRLTNESRLGLPVYTRTTKILRKRDKNENIDIPQTRRQSVETTSSKGGRDTPWRQGQIAEMRIVPGDRDRKGRQYKNSEA
jgi:hypothetical protein